MPRTLSAPVTVAFDYTRSTGPVLGRFLSGLRDGVVVGGRTSDGKVVAIPTAAYAQALHYNRALFTQAGLDPNKPPTTWD